MADCKIHWAETFLPNVSTSLIETRQLLPSRMPTVADCALVCLQSTSCLTAIFNSQMGTCKMFSEGLDSGGQLMPASSNDITTIGVKENIVSSKIFIRRNDTVYAVWNVSAGKDSYPSSPGRGAGQYWYLYAPSNVFDGNLTSLFCSYGTCAFSVENVTCGQNTGVYATVQQDPFVLEAFRIATGQITVRDPLAITIEGSNQIGSALTLGSSWTLIYNGTSGLSTDPGRYSLGVKQAISNNILAFASYRFLVVAKRGVEDCVEYAEIQLFGHQCEKIDYIQKTHCM